MRSRRSKKDEPCAKCSALTWRSPGAYGVSMSRNSASNLIALSERMSIDFMREITKVTKNWRIEAYESGVREKD